MREPIDITSTYRNARTIGKNRALFSLKGNTYRLVVAIRYDKGIVFIRFVETQDQCNKIDALAIEASKESL